jgi:hypothetical protein
MSLLGYLWAHDTCLHFTRSNKKGSFTRAARVAITTASRGPNRVPTTCRSSIIFCRKTTHTLEWLSLQYVKHCVEIVAFSVFSDYHLDLRWTSNCYTPTLQNTKYRKTPYKKHHGGYRYNNNDDHRVPLIFDIS